MSSAVRIGRSREKDGGRTGIVASIDGGILHNLALVGYAGKARLAARHSILPPNSLSIAISQVHGRGVHQDQHRQQHDDAGRGHVVELGLACRLAQS